MLEPQVNSEPTTCPLGMLGGEPHTIATKRQRDVAGLYESAYFFNLCDSF